MGKNTHITQETIAQIVALSVSGLQTKEIVSQIGVSARTVRRWVAKFHNRGGEDAPTHKRRPGPSKKTNERCRNILKRQLEGNPRITARKIKEDNPELLGEVSVRSVNRLIAELGYKRHRPVKKPMLTHKGELFL